MKPTNIECAPSRRKWFAVRTHPKKEDLAKVHLERQEYDTCLPRIKMARARRRKGSVDFAPLFPSYLFVSLDLERDHWRPIDSTVGVSTIVKFGPRPTPLPEGFVETLILSLDSRGVVRFDEQLTHGDRVTLVGGSFDSMKGIYETQTGEGRVSVLLDMMSRQVRVTVPRQEIIASAR